MTWRDSLLAGIVIGSAWLGGYMAGERVQRHPAPACPACPACPAPTVRVGTPAVVITTCDPLEDVRAAPAPRGP